MSVSTWHLAELNVYQPATWQRQQLINQAANLSAEDNVDDWEENES